MFYTFYFVGKGLLINDFDDVVVEDDDLNLRRDFLGPKALLIFYLLFLNLDRNYNRKN